METDAEGVWNAPAGKLVLCRKEDNTFTYASPLDMEIIEYNTIDWSSFRREAAKDILCALLTGNEGYHGDGENEMFAKQAVGLADDLIRQL